MSPDPIARALASCTATEARIVWEALTQWIDNSDPDLEETTHERHAAAVALRDRLDAAAQTFAERPIE